MSNRWRRNLALLPLVAATLAVACSDQQRTRVTAPTAGPQAVLSANGVITDDWNGGPLHGAIFTTLPFGQVVNANVQYTRKIEVYLDGGPRNANSMAAGLNDGLYVFQITDPPGKTLLSMDPARCRVVQVKGGVILGTVPAPRIPGLNAATDNWTDNGSTAKKACHIESSETDGASLAGQHDTNVDTDPGGGMTVQMMPFLDTPNPGGVYKAWMTPLAVYLDKGGNLNTVPTAKGQAVGYTPDVGFKNPSRQNVKTDNFKVVEKPPFIEIRKFVDGVETAGWMATVYESVDGGWVGAGWKPTPATFAVPFSTDVLACERTQTGYSFVSATIDGAPATVSDALTQDEDGNPIKCVNVPGVSTSKTVALAFNNHLIPPPKPKAKILIAPQNATNLLPYKHTLTGSLYIDHDLGAGWENAPNGSTISFKILSGPAGTLTPTSCTTTSGSCSVELTSTAAGVQRIEASSSITVDGTELSVKTDSTADNSPPATKVWVNAKISIAPPTATNGIYDPHGLKATVQINYGDPDKFVAAPDGLRIDFTILSGPGALDPLFCLTTSGTGMCATTLTSTVAGTTKVEASTTIDHATVPAVPSGQSMTIKTDGTGLNSGPAVKNWITGTLVWEKQDWIGQRLAGATFQVCRTHDYVLSTGVYTPLASPDCFPDIVDNGTLDKDPAAGVFKLTDLRLGRYTIKETVAPLNYLLDPRTLTANVISATTVTVGPFVDNLNGRMTGGTGQVILDLPDGSRFLTAGFTIHCDILLSNNLEINWKDEAGNARKWHLTKPIQTAKCTDNPDVRPGQPDALFDTFEGTAEGTLDGVAGSWVHFVFVDAGEPGKRADLTRIEVYSGAIGSAIVMQINGTNSITGYSGLARIRGDIQAHLDQPHK